MFSEKMGIVLSVAVDQGRSKQLEVPTSPMTSLPFAKYDTERAEEGRREGAKEAESRGKVSQGLEECIATAATRRLAYQEGQLAGGIG